MFKAQGRVIKVDSGYIYIFYDNKIIECKRCHKKYNDTENKSGSITHHMKTCYPEIKIPSKLFRSNYKKDNGEFWHFQYFLE